MYQSIYKSQRGREHKYIVERKGKGEVKKKRKERDREYHVTLSTQLYSPTSDAPFEAQYVLKALEPFSPSSPAYKMLKITEQVEFEDYLRDHPNAFSWKTVAEVLYRCGDEKRLDTLFTYMKSPEGRFTLRPSFPISHTP